MSQKLRWFRESRKGESSLIEGTLGRSPEGAKAGEPSGLLQILGRKCAVSSHHSVLLPRQLSEVSLSHTVAPCLSPLLQDLVTGVASCLITTIQLCKLEHQFLPSSIQIPRPFISPEKWHEVCKWSPHLKSPSPHLTQAVRRAL